MGHKNQLLDLPDELLGAVLRQLSDGKTRLQIFRTSKRLATVLLQHMPVIQLTYPLVYRENADDIKPIAPFMTKALHDRYDPPLHLRLHPEKKLFKAIKAVAAGNRLTARSLSALELCPAVTCLTLRFIESFTFSWEPVFSAALAASFPSLTHLILKDVTLSATQLRQVISHPLLLPRLRGLGLCDARITDAARLATSPFTGGKLQELYMRRYTGWDFTPHLTPLAPHLTHLAVLSDTALYTSQWDSLAAAVSSMTCMQRLELSMYMELEPGEGFSAMLPVLAHLPSLNTLMMSHERVVGQDQLDALLALTQITYLVVNSFCNLTESRATAGCSWQQLVLKQTVWSPMQLLPLHSLTHPLHVDVIHSSFRPGGAIEDVVAAAELNMCERNKAGLVVDDMRLNRAAIDLLTEQYLSHSRRTAQQPPHPTVASSSHSGPSTSLPSSSPEGHITPGGPGVGQGGQHGATAGRQALMQRLGPFVKRVLMEAMALSQAHLSSADMRALTALFPSAGVKFV